MKRSAEDNDEIAMEITKYHGHLKLDVIYLLNNWTLMNENIWMNTFRTKNGGTWKSSKEKIVNFE